MNLGDHPHTDANMNYMKMPDIDTPGWLAAIVDSSDDAIFSTDLDGIITSWNASTTRMFGYQADEMLNQSILKLIPPERLGDETHILGLIRKGERIRHYSTVRRCKDGRLLNVSLTLSPIFDDQRQIIGVSRIARDITEWKILQETQMMLLREINHRSKNLLAVADAIVRQIAKTTPAKYLSSRITSRFVALAVNQDLLIERGWRGAELMQIVHAQLAPIVEDFGARVAIEGPSILLKPAVAQAMALTLFELGTNALKYGALSVSEGKLAISWTIAENLANPGARDFKLTWRESGGPKVSRPRRKGFGHTIIENMIAHSVQGKSTMTYHRAGLVWELTTTEVNLLTDAGGDAPLLLRSQPPV